jgi:hypothetical protein
VYLLGRSLALALLVGLLPVDSPLLPVGVLAVMSASLVAHLWVRPWRRAVDNALETAVLVAAALSYLLNITTGATAARFAAEGHGDTAPSASGARSIVSVIDLAVLFTLGIGVCARPVLERALACASSSRRRLVSPDELEVE